MPPHARDFQVFAPLTFFEKSDAEAGKKKRIAGVVSTEKLDKQEERIVQKGLNFEPFVKEGWFNDNHSKKTADILGYPDGPVRFFQKGDRLPDGNVAEHNCTWAEGYLLDTPEASRIWNLGIALKKSGSQRRLGFSIEGSVDQRDGPSGKTVAKATVRNVAITNCPVGHGTRLEVLAKSLSMGTATPGQAVSGPKTGDGAGQVLAIEDLEHEGQERLKIDGEPKPRELTKAEAVTLIRNRLGCSYELAEKTFATLQTLKARGRL